jgi:hypothetical protein
MDTSKAVPSAKNPAMPAEVDKSYDSPTNPRDRAPEKQARKECPEVTPSSSKTTPNHTHNLRKRRPA